MSSALEITADPKYEGQDATRESRILQVLFQAKAVSLFLLTKLVNN